MRLMINYDVHLSCDVLCIGMTDVLLSEALLKVRHNDFLLSLRILIYELLLIIRKLVKWRTYPRQNCKSKKMPFDFSMMQIMGKLISTT